MAFKRIPLLLACLWLVTSMSQAATWSDKDQYHKITEWNTGGGKYDGFWRNNGVLYFVRQVRYDYGWKHSGKYPIYQGNFAEYAAEATQYGKYAELQEALLNEDSDGDGVSDYWELDQEDGDYRDANVQPAAPDPYVIDTRYEDDDGDGLKNINDPDHELYDPNHPYSDSDDDGTVNCWDSDSRMYQDDDGDGLKNIWDPDSEYYDPEWVNDLADADNDGLPNRYDPDYPASMPDDPLYDADQDGTPDINDPDAGAKYDATDYHSDHDDDGVPNYADPQSEHYDPRKGDHDDDGLSDLYDPDSRYYDSDGNGIPDVKEWWNDAYDPNDPHNINMEGIKNINNPEWAEEYGDDETYGGAGSWLNTVNGGSVDLNKNGIADNIDPTSPLYDGNGDGIPDAQQNPEEVNIDENPYDPTAQVDDNINVSESLSFTDQLIKALGLNLFAINRYSESEYTASVDIPIGGTLDNLSYHTVDFSLNPDNLPSSQSAAQPFLTTIKNVITIFMYLAVSWLFFRNIYQLLWNL